MGAVSRVLRGEVGQDPGREEGRGHAAGAGMPGVASSPIIPASVCRLPKQKDLWAGTRPAARKNGAGGRGQASRGGE